MPLSNNEPAELHDRPPAVAAPRINIDDVIVVGAGIAGLSAARALLLAGASRVRVLEREIAPCTHASGRNAAIFRHLTATPGDLELALRSRELLDDLVDGSWLRRTGAWYVASSTAALDPLVANAVLGQCPHRLASGDALWREIPTFRGGPLEYGVFSENDGVIDIHAVTLALLRSIAAMGGRVLFDSPIDHITLSNGCVRGVQLGSGEVLSASHVVLAAGAWSADLGALSRASMSLQPRRRHLIQISTPHGVEPDAPVVWSLGDELYVRPESGGLLASPCDEVSCGADESAFDPASLELLSHKLTRLAPPLAESSVRRGWACLRTFAPDGRPVVGPDPRISGLSWLGGLGGHGMTGGVAAGELLASTLVRSPHVLTDLLSPARFF